MTHEIYVVVESSRAGNAVVGVFSSMASARRILPVDDFESLKSYRVELHVLDEPQDAAQAWRVAMDRDGGNVEVARVVLCSCEDDEVVLDSGSYIEDGGRRMQLIVWARTQGRALAAADRCRGVLIERGVWQSGFVPLSGIAAQAD